MQNMIAEEAWTDVGKEAHVWQGVSEQCTCHAPNAHGPTRRDYIMVTKGILPRVKGCRVDYNDEFPTHWAIQMKIEASRQKKSFYKLAKTDSADAALTSL